MPEQGGMGKWTFAGYFRGECVRELD